MSYDSRYSVGYEHSHTYLILDTISDSTLDKCTVASYTFVMRGSLRVLCKVSVAHVDGDDCAFLRESATSVVPILMGNFGDCQRSCRCASIAPFLPVRCGCAVLSRVIANQLPSSIS